MKKFIDQFFNLIERISSIDLISNLTDKSYLFKSQDNLKNISNTAVSTPKTNLKLLTIAIISCMAASGVQAKDEKSGCLLNSVDNKIKYVVVIGFDNFHFKRDNPNVPSDLEQVPSLYNFLTKNGVLLTNYNTALPSHTANGFASAQTGLYAEKHGFISNNLTTFNAVTKVPQVRQGHSYWTTKFGDYYIGVPPANNTYFRISDQIGSDGMPKNAPAPWTVFTRAGCEVGSTADGFTINPPPSRQPVPSAAEFGNIFGRPSLEYNAALENRNLAYANYGGVVIHCPKDSTICDANKTKLVDDILPDEPGGYVGYKAIHGYQYIKPIISPNADWTDTAGQVIRCFLPGCKTGPGANGDVTQYAVGFPGITSNRLNAQVALGIGASMLESGIPIYYGRVDGAHFPPSPTFPPLGAAQVTTGPGAADYQEKLKGMELAFKNFFTRLAAAGIDQSNTLFVFYPEEEDTFNGASPSPEGCDGVTTACTYSTPAGAASPFGTTAVNLQVPYLIDGDSLHIFLTGIPGPTDPATRAAQRQLAALQFTNFYTGQNEIAFPYLADDHLIQMLHIKTADPYRFPSFMGFMDEHVIVSDPTFILATPTDNRFVWSHGTISPQINQGWLGLVGPGVRSDSGKGGQRSEIWSDHTDVRPTILTLLGLKDVYQHQGRALIEVLQSGAIPKTLNAHRNTLLCLSNLYKQVNAPLGRLSLAALKVNTAALAGGSPSDDSAYLSERAMMGSILARRDALVANMEATLTNATFNQQEVNEKNAKDLINQGQDLIKEVELLAGIPEVPVDYCNGNNE